MTKQKFEEILTRNAMVSSEVDDAIAFVTELLEFKTDELKRNEPYATRTIRELEKAANEVWNLQDYISDLEDDE